MNRRTLLASFFMVSFLLNAVSFAEDKSEVDGTWELIGFNENGKDDPASVSKKFVIVRKDGVQTITKGGEDVNKSRFTVDTKATPKVITFTGVEKGGSTTIGIYAVDGDTMKVAAFMEQKTDPVKPPKDFQPAEGKTIATYRRVK